MAEEQDEDDELLLAVLQEFRVISRCDASSEKCAYLADPGENVPRGPKHVSVADVLASLRYMEDSSLSVIADAIGRERRDRTNRKLFADAIHQRCTCRAVALHCAFCGEHWYNMRRSPGCLKHRHDPLPDDPTCPFCQR